MNIKWNVITWKNGERKNHYYITKDGYTAEQVGISFSLRYNGDEGEVLEIVPMDIMEE